MTSKASVKIPRVKGLSPKQFFDQFMMKRKPAIIEDAINEWPALKKWTSDMFKQEHGDRHVTIDSINYRLKEIVDLALNSKSDEPAPYYRNIQIRDEWPELMGDILPYPKLCGSNWFHSSVFFPIRNRIVGGGGHFEFFLGGAGRSFPFLHFDSPGAHTFIFQITGRKKFLLFSPDDSPYLYPCDGKSFSVSQIKDIENVDLKEFPLFEKATLYEDEAGPGDALFMPSGWWHTAKMLSFSVSLGLDVVNRSNWKDVENYMSRRMKFENPLIGAAYMAYIRTAGAFLKVISK